MPGEAETRIEKIAFFCGIAIDKTGKIRYYITVVRAVSSAG
jgi:hypothetical protein